MTHQDECPAINDLTALLIEHGPAGKAKKVTDADWRKLVELLRKHSAWEQQEAGRPAVPDESKARLTVSYGEDSTSVWEWHKDLKSNQRLLDVREAMKNSAWESPP